MVYISSIGANIDLLGSGGLNFLVAHSSPDFLECLLKIVRLWVSYNANTVGPLRLLRSQEVFINIVLDILNDNVNAVSNLVRWVSLEILLIAGVV